MRTSVFAALAVALGASALVESAPATDKISLAAVQDATAGKMKAMKGTFNDRDCGQVSYEAEAIDLNSDGQLEVLTKEYGPCFGRAGVQMNLFIKGKNGKWMPQFGFPGEPNILKTKSRGYPDIEVGGPGTCFPIWRYNGQQYNLFKKCN